MSFIVGSYLFAELCKFDGSPVLRYNLLI